VYNGSPVLVHSRNCSFNLLMECSAEMIWRNIFLSTIMITPRIDKCDLSILTVQQLANIRSCRLNICFPMKKTSHALYKQAIGEKLQLFEASF
jgi:hypothetical protein